MNNIPGTQVQRARLIALDLAALVLRAAAVGLCVALVLAGATLLFSSQSEAAAETPQAAGTDTPGLATPRRGESK
jgi:hypothetical protein